MLANIGRAKDRESFYGRCWWQGEVQYRSTGVQLQTVRERNPYDPGEVFRGTCAYLPVQTCIFEDIEMGEKKDIFNEINPYDLYTCELYDNWYAMEITAEPIKPVLAKGQLGIWEWDPK